MAESIKVMAAHSSAWRRAVCGAPDGGDRRWWLDRGVRRELTGVEGRREAGRAGSCRLALLGWFERPPPKIPSENYPRESLFFVLVFIFISWAKNFRAVAKGMTSKCYSPVFVHKCPLLVAISVYALLILVRVTFRLYELRSNR